MSGAQPSALGPAAETGRESLLRAQSVAHVGNWELDLASRFVKASPEACRLYGIDAARTGLPLEQVQAAVVAADRPRLDALLAQLLTDDDAYDTEFTIQPLDGAPARVIRSVAYVERAADGTPLRVHGVIHDVTEKHAAHEQLRKLSRAVEQSPVSILITDREGRIEYVNPRFTAVTGFTVDDVRGRTSRLLKSGQMHPSVYEDLWKTIASGKEWRGNLHNRKKSGEVFWERAVISPIVDAAGAITHYVGVKEDITEQLQLEEALRQSQKMEAVGQLASGVAHDFNNLLAVILSYATTALEEAKSLPQVCADLHEVIGAVERAGALTGQLLAFGRRQHLAPEALDLNAVVESLRRMLSRTLGEKVALELHLASDLERAQADRGQIGQVIMNLAVNARDAMPDGGRILLRTANAVTDDAWAARHPGRSAGPYVQLSVQDSGCGMSAPTLARIFEPFFTTKGLGKGTGLGLSTVMGIVQQTLGAIDVRSAPGRGTTFDVYLPRATRPTPETQAKDGVRRPAPIAGATVLLVEDDEPLRRVMSRALQREGYQVLAADSAEAALERSQAASTPVDLLVTDVILPRMDGRELAEQLRAKAPELRVLYVSGYSGARLDEPGVLDRRSAFLKKPLGIAELNAAVAKLLRPA